VLLKSSTVQFDDNFQEKLSITKNEKQQKWADYMIYHKTLGMVLFFLSLKNIYACVYVCMHICMNVCICIPMLYIKRCREMFMYLTPRALENSKMFL
jgi:hypothetical protein